ncbi:MAG: hypothetical protein GF411_00625, partial [Candidatus Lokiarchaeota archaeon]|nr:hypothetical protein [Candidatus Lokiarchaeota archaeon]
MRPLTARQRMFLRSPNANVVMVGRIRGAFSISEIEDTLISLEKIHPLLRVKIHLDDDNKAWFSQEVEKSISVEFVTGDWKSVAKDELEYQHPVFEGPLIRFRLIEKGDDIHVVINCHHSICDALSIVYLFRDLLQILSGDAEEQQVIDPVLVSEESVPVGIKGNFLVRWLMGRFNKKWHSAGHKIENSDFDEIPELFWKSNSFEIHSKQLTDDETSQIIKRAKDHDITVGSFLLTALIASQQQVQKEKEYHEQIVVSVDFRDRLQPDPGDAFCFYASAVRPKIKYDKGKTVWENSESVY